MLRTTRRKAENFGLMMLMTVCHRLAFMAVYKASSWAVCALRPASPALLCRKISGFRKQDPTESSPTTPESPATGQATSTQISRLRHIWTQLHCPVLERLTHLWAHVRVGHLRVCKGGGEGPGDRRLATNVCKTSSNNQKCLTRS